MMFVRERDIHTDRQTDRERAFLWIIPSCDWKRESPSYCHVFGRGIFHRDFGFLILFPDVVDDDRVGDFGGHPQFAYMVCASLGRVRHGGDSCAAAQGAEAASEGEGPELGSGSCSSRRSASKRRVQERSDGGGPAEVDTDPSTCEPPLKRQHGESPHMEEEATGWVHVDWTDLPSFAEGMNIDRYRWLNVLRELCSPHCCWHLLGLMMWALSPVVGFSEPSRSASRASSSNLSRKEYSVHVCWMKCMVRWQFLAPQCFIITLVSSLVHFFTPCCSCSGSGCNACCDAVQTKCSGEDCVEGKSYQDGATSRTAGRQFGLVPGESGAY